MNDSPWLAEIPERPSYPCPTKNAGYDVGIIGGGISGVISAYYLLHYTSLHLVLIEGKRIAHGATGHNAGQVVLDFERSFNSLVEEYGLTKTKRAIKDLQKGWSVLHEILDDLGEQELLEVSVGYDGLRDETQFFTYLEDELIRHDGNIPSGHIFVTNNAPFRSNIPTKYLHHITFIDHDTLAKILLTKPGFFHAAVASKKGTINSALLCEKIIDFLHKKYPKRLTIHEESPVDEIRIEKKKVSIMTCQKTLSVNQVVLATNGYKQLQIIDLTEYESNYTDYRLRKNIKGLIGYMQSYKITHQSASAITYFSDLPPDDFGDCYYYATNRNNYSLLPKNKSLYCLGGPSRVYMDTRTYREEDIVGSTYFAELEEFMRTYHLSPKVEKQNEWHGIMGYTETMMKIIGPDKDNPHLWYNVGCNGAGIVTSIFGGWKIGKMLAGEKFPPSIFDPQI